MERRSSCKYGKIIHLVYYNGSRYAVTHACTTRQPLAGVEITKLFSLSFGKVSKGSTCPTLFLPVLDRQTVNEYQNFSLSLRQVSQIFTCPPLYFYLSRTCPGHPWPQVSEGTLDSLQTAIFMSGSSQAIGKYTKDFIPVC